MSSRIYKAPQQGGRSPPKWVFSAPSILSPGTPTGAWAAPPHPPFHPGRVPEREGVVEAKRCREAGSAPIWRAAVAGKQGAEGTETCVTSFSLRSLLPSPTGPCLLLEGAPGPRLQMAVGVKGKRVKGETGVVRELFAREGNPDPYPPSRGRAPLTSVGERSP